MSNLHFKIVTPERVVFEDTVTSVTLPTAEGEITILPHHIPIVSMLVAGVARIHKNGQEIPLAVSSGVIEVSGQSIVVLADTAERADELEEAKIEQARKVAEDLMHARRGDAEGFAEATAMLERELVRLKVARKYRAHRGPNPTSSQS